MTNILGIVGSARPWGNSELLVRQALRGAAAEGAVAQMVRLTSLHIDPCIPPRWKGFEVTYRHGGSVYRIRVENPKGVSRGVCRVSLDGTLLSGEGLVPLSDDGSEHRVQVVLG